MRILIVGAGAVGGYFGARLAEAGRDVSFLVRPRRADQLRASGLVIRSPLGDVKLPPRLVGRDDLTPYDVVLLTVKSYGLAGAIDDLAGAVGPGTVIVPVLNGMAHIDLLRQRFGEEQVLGGLCVIAAQLEADGSIQHLGMDPTLTFGELDGSRSHRAERILAELTVPGFTARLSEMIMAELWEKWVFLSSAAAITCLLRGSIGEVEAVGGAEIATAIIEEATSVAAAAGYRPREAADRRTRTLLTQAGSTFTASMYRDLQQGLPVEADHIIGDLVDRGLAAGVRVPLLTATRVALDVYQRRRAKNTTPGTHDTPQNPGIE